MKRLSPIWKRCSVWTRKSATKDNLRNQTVMKTLSPIWKPGSVYSAKSFKLSNQHTKRPQHVRKKRWPQQISLEAPNIRILPFQMTAEAAAEPLRKAELTILGNRLLRKCLTTVKEATLAMLKTICTTNSRCQHNLGFILESSLSTIIRNYLSSHPGNLLMACLVEASIPDLRNKINPRAV